MSDKPAVYFGMPLRSSATTRRWPHISALFCNTIRSILQQSDPDFHILVACHEQPEMEDIDDPRLEFLMADNPRPPDVKSQMADKLHKIRMIADEICRRGGGYFFLMDADDLVSNQLVDYIRQHHNASGFLVAQGFILNIGRRNFQPVSDFWRQCGSCAIFYLRPDDLEAGKAGLPAKLTTSGVGHRGFARISGNAGRPLEVLPFPAAIYVRNHGENRSAQRRPWKVNIVRNVFYRAFGALHRSKPIPARLKAEFRIPYDANCPMTVPE